LATVDNEVRRAYIERRVDLWINGTTGSDLLPGNSEANAVKTIPALKALIRKYQISCNYFVINMRGTITLTPGTAEPTQDEYDFSNTLIFDTITDVQNANDSWVAPTIIIQGDTETTVVLDNGSGGNIVSDLNGAGYIGKSGSGWAANQHKGWWCEIKSGPLAGRRFIVEENDAEKLYLIGSQQTSPPNTPIGLVVDYPGWDVDPGAGAEFVLTRPSTTITSGWPEVRLQFVLRGPGRMYVNHLYFAGSAVPTMWTGEDRQHCWIEFGNTIHNAFSIFGFVTNTGSWMVFDGGYWDLSADTPTYQKSDTGVSYRKNPIMAVAFLYGKDHRVISNSLMPPCYFFMCHGGTVVKKTKIQHMNFVDCPQTDGHGGYSSLFYSKVGGGPNMGNIYFPAIQAHNTSLDMIGTKLQYAGHGVRLTHSVLTMADISGDNLLWSGVFADHHSDILLPPGKPIPTVAGNGGAVELSKDGATELATWLAIAGTPPSGTIDCDNVGTDVIPADEETFTLNDGLNTPTVFKFNRGTPVTEEVYLREVDISAASDEDDVRDEIIAAVFRAPALNMVASSGGAGIVNLTNTVRRDRNASNSDTVTDVKFVVSDMTGGVDPVPTIDPEVTAKVNTLRNATWSF
jgi:hypothetical protein